MLRPFARGFSLGLRKFVTRSKPLERDELLKKVCRAWEAVCAGVWQKSVRERVAQRRNVSPPARPFFLTPTLPWLQWNLKFYEAPRDWQNVFALTRLRYIVVLFYIFYYNSGKENRSLYWGLLEAFYIEVPLYLQAPARQDTWETNLIKNKGEETLQCSLKWGKRTQGWIRYWSLLMIHSLPLGRI